LTRLCTTVLPLRASPILATSRYVIAFRPMRCFPGTAEPLQRCAKRCCRCIARPIIAMPVCLAGPLLPGASHIGPSLCPPPHGDAWLPFHCICLALPCPPIRCVSADAMRARRLLNHASPNAAMLFCPCHPLRLETMQDKALLPCRCAAMVVAASPCCTCRNTSATTVRA